MVRYPRVAKIGQVQVVVNQKRNNSTAAVRPAVLGCLLYSGETQTVSLSIGTALGEGGRVCVRVPCLLHSRFRLCERTDNTPLDK